ncbi:MAG: flagellar filament capping protein FliD [Deltaproteobacteria bacterium]|nr:flagellar filament capping protein FliD [Deltaproteobacteria bacterium]
MTIPLITFSGLATGLDTKSLIASLVDVARQPIYRLEYNQKNLESQSERLTALKTKLETLKSAAEGLDAEDDVLAVKATSGNEDYFTATAAAGATTGSYNISVTALANAERTYSDPFASATQTGLVGTGNLQITINGVQTDVAIDQTTDTLTTVMDKINASGADVTAGLIYTGTAWRLSVTGNQTGAANAITFTEGGSLVLNLDKLANQLQAATDSTFTVDGITISRSTNTVSDAIPSVTLNLEGVQSSGSTVLTIDRDPAAVQADLQTFIAAYNAVMTSLNEEFAWTGEAKGPDSLSGDSTLRSLQSRLRSLVGQTISGANPYSSLSMIGVSTDKYGIMSLDATKLTAALAASPSDVVALLAKSTSGGTDGIMAQMSAAIYEYTKSSTGLITAKIDGIATRVADMDDQIEQMEARLDKYEETLQAQFAALEALVSSLQGQGSAMTSILGSMQNND